MNQKGEVTLFTVMVVFVLSSLLLLCQLELRRSYGLLQKRTHLFLCTKETKGELDQHLTLMGKSNWAIENAQKARLIMLLIPGLQGASGSVENVKKAIMKYQDVKAFLYLAKLKTLKSRGCPMDTRVFMTPFQLKIQGHARDQYSRARLREETWTYYFLEKPYLLSLTVTARNLSSLKPKPHYESKEKGARLSSLLSLR